MFAIAYIRFSSTEQKKGGSLSRQTETIAAHIAAKGWVLDNTILDDGRSGYKAEHRRADRGLGGFELEALAGEHVGKVLVVERLDRLTRESPQKTWGLITKLVDAGVSIATVESDKFYAAYAELDMLSILEVLFKASGNNEESEKKSKHIAREWEKRRDRAKANGTALTKLSPPWLSVNSATRQFSIIPDRAALVAEWFRLADEEGIGAQAIAKRMEGAGVKPWARFEGREPKVWQRTFIGRVLSNREVLGEYQPKRGGEPDGEPWIGHLPAIVTHDVFNRVNAAAPTRKKASNRKSVMRTNLLAGLCKCAGCGATMAYHRGRGAGKTWVSPKGKKYSYKRENGSLVCPTAQTSKGMKCGNRAYWAYLTLEKSVLDHTLHLAMDDAAFSNNGDVARLGQDLGEAERDLDLLKTRERRLWGAYADGNEGALDLAQEIKVQREIAEGKIADLKRQRTVASGRVSSRDHLRRVKDIADNLYCDDHETRLALRGKVQVQLNTLIETIVLDSHQAFLRFVADAGFIYIDRKGALVAGIDTIGDAGRQPASVEDFKRRRDAAKDAGAFTLPKLGDMDWRDAVAGFVNQPKLKTET